jgi:hypothetical protein
MEAAQHVEAAQRSSGSENDLEDVPTKEEQIKDVNEKEDLAASEAAMDAEIALLEERSQGVKRPRLEWNFSNPAFFTYIVVPISTCPLI